jgi:intraflagellar transport protein 80
MQHRYDRPPTTAPLLLRDASPKTPDIIPLPPCSFSALLTGAIRLMTRTGRVEKTFDAHSGAVTCLKWHDDASSGLISGGEDGFLKHWSRNGNIRSKIAQSDRSIYSCGWSPDSTAVIYASGQYLCIKPLAANAGGSAGGGVGAAAEKANGVGVNKQIKWKAHDATVLKVDWNAVSNLIVSAGEDRKVKVPNSAPALTVRSVLSVAECSPPASCCLPSPLLDLGQFRSRAVHEPSV